VAYKKFRIWSETVATKSSFPKWKASQSTVNWLSTIYVTKSTHCNLTLSSPNGVEIIYLGSWLLTALGRQKTDGTEINAISYFG